MRITMKTLSAHPDGTLEIGKTYEVPGQCGEERAAELLDGGYAVLAEEDLSADDPGPAEAADPEADKPLEKRTVDQLKAYAAEHGIDLGDAGKKAEILDRITTELARREAESGD
ncbi:hypothetical protein GCM10011578_101590 [Streptomyces fuscichromogenes]|uniref:Rho termination factor N-terminal domain-containing protein n=2 Tax=Streptomyces fuscichromogenes TaxID=1324013 RepID=A0A917XQM1_9ACTN|nr:hypothetical protein GCM10011578_101590 [Streptomyces fuscichromogenes]